MLTFSMIYSKFFQSGLISTSCVIAWILARPFANFMQLSQDVVYGPLFLALILASFAALIFYIPIVPKPVGWAALYLGYLGVNSLLQVIYDDVPLGVTIHGFAALGLPALIYLIAMQSSAEARDRALQLFVGPVLGLSAIVSVLYFYFDFTLWGAIQHHIYTDKIYTNYAVDLRAIGLLTSPQSHALSMVVLLAIAVMGRQARPRISIALGLLAIIGGILSGSKAFLLGALLIAMFCMNRRILMLSVFLLLVFAFFWEVNLSDSSLRAFTLFRVIQNIEDYPAIPLWKAALNYASDFTTLFTGFGPGVMGGLSGLMALSPLYFSSTESYLLQITVEVGLLGLFLFAMFFLSALSYSANSGTPALSRALFFAVFINAFFSPALYGFGNAALAGLLLAHTRRIR